MKKKYIATGLLALSVLAVTAGASTVSAAGFNAKTSSLFNKFNMHSQVEASLTADQKAALKTKMDAVNAALAAGDYNAWVTAETALNAKSPLLTKITATTFPAYAAKYQAQVAKQTDQKNKIAAVNAAITAGNYSAWVTAETALNAKSNLLTKITADNFGQYTQAISLQKQAQTIMTNLGLNGKGMGEREEGFGMGRGL